MTLSIETIHDFAKNVDTSFSKIHTDEKGFNPTSELARLGKVIQDVNSEKDDSSCFQQQVFNARLGLRKQLESMPNTIPAFSRRPIITKTTTDISVTEKLTGFIFMNSEVINSARLLHQKDATKFDKLMAELELRERKEVVEAVRSFSELELVEADKNEGFEYTSAARELEVPTPKKEDVLARRPASSKRQELENRNAAIFTL